MHNSLRTHSEILKKFLPKGPWKKDFFFFGKRPKVSLNSPEAACKQKGLRWAFKLETSKYLMQNAAREINRLQVALATQNIANLNAVL